MFLEKLAKISARFIKIGNTRISFAGSFVCCSMNRICAVLSLVVYRSVLWNPGTKKNVLDEKTIADMGRNRKCWPKLRPHRQKKAEYECMNGD